MAEIQPGKVTTSGLNLVKSKSMKSLIKSRIKQKYGTIANYCDTENRGDHTNFPKLINTVINKIDWLNKFLDPLGLKIEIKDK